MRQPLTLAHLADIVLTRDPSKRRHLSMWLMSTVTYVVYQGLLWSQVALGYSSQWVAVTYTAVIAAVNAYAYLGIRLGWGPRWDRDLGIFQMGWGLFSMWMTYAAAGPASGATSIILATLIVYAVFGMTARNVWVYAVLGLAGLALTMVVCHWAEPERYPAGVQAITWGYTSLAVTLIARLATLVTTMSNGLRSQRRELAAALEKVSQLATRDDLTQVHNRRHITELMLVEKSQHEHSGSPLCLALIDIDFFKAVNDRFGHHAGDEVLRHFAHTAQQALRDDDLLGRWGGEEFVVLFPDTSLDQAQVALLRMREQLQQTDFDRIAPGLHIRFSAGLVLVALGERIETAVERADQALYRAKARGRDRVECDVPQPAVERKTEPAHA